MAKRLTDTEKWNRPWFRDLPLPYRELWLYMLDTCDIAGIWYVDLAHASFLIGQKIEREEAARLLAKQIRMIDDSRWLIREFAAFQYGVLTPTNNLHKSVMAKLAEIAIPGARRPKKGKEVPVKFSGADEGQNSPSRGAKDKDKDIVSVGSKVIGGVGERFSTIWSIYPNKDGRKAAELHFNASVKTEKDWLDIQKALRHYLRSENVLRGFVKNGSTWFNNWRDWIDYDGKPEVATPAPPSARTEPPPKPEDCVSPSEVHSLVKDLARKKAMPGVTGR